MKRGPELIITEKDNAARRIAEILSGGSAEAERSDGVNVYKWGGKRCIGLSGHVVGVDFPAEYADWRDVEPVELIDAAIEKRPTQEGIVRALRRLARNASRIVIATDYDREGELIGKEALDLVREVNDEAPVDRVRFSSITDREVTEAFRTPDELDVDLAAAGEARQVVDLVWGAALTRFLSLSARQLGDDFISVGRVQGPTLKLIVDREREIEAFDPEAYWELFADLAKADGRGFEAQYFYIDDDGTEAERIWDEGNAEAAYAGLQAASAAQVASVRRRTRTDAPPAPFNTTQFIRAAGSLGYSAQRAMSIAEDLYTAGYMTYPRTDNTVYPEDLEPRELLGDFEGHYEFGDDASSLLEQESITPTAGDTESTDHPPIHPTGEIPSRSDLSDDEWEVYELVVRHFFATVAEPAEWEHLRVVAEVDAAGAASDAGGVAAADGGAAATPGDGDALSLKANGKRLVEPGYHAVYPYRNASENLVPDVTEGEELSVSDVRLEDKETQPPRRYGQSRLIETMEDLGVGTKCLTEDTIVLSRADDGDVRRVPIGDLFDEAEVEPLCADGDADVTVVEGGPRTISLDHGTGRTTERERTLVSRRPISGDERVLTVETESGSLSVTDDHPMYVRTADGFEIRPASELATGDRLVTTRGPSSTGTPTPDGEATGDENGEGGPIVVSWPEFAASCDESTMLFGANCAGDVRPAREDLGETQDELAARTGTHQGLISAYECDRRDPPVWLLGELGVRPDRLHGQNYDTSFANPFPLEWSDRLARLLGHVLGDGSVHVNEAENVVDVRYHNTDERLVERFVDDVEAVFDVEPTVLERRRDVADRETYHQVHLPGAVSRVVRFVLDRVTEGGRPRIPERFQPAFVGALFDDEGHISRERKAFVSGTDHELLAAVGEMLADRGIEPKLAPAQHKLHVRGRRNLERFLEVVPISADEKFYRGLDGLREYHVTQRKAELLELIVDEPLTTDELAARLEESRGVVQTTLEELKDEGYVETRIEGSNRSHDGNRTFRYSVDRDAFEASIYARLRGVPSSTLVTGVREREYDGPVYDLTIDEDAPNFAVGGGIVVHNSTRHEVLEKLYDRGYVEGDPPRPTKLARAVVEAAEEFAEQIVSEEMTAQLEEDMRAIAEGELTYDEVTDESRELLRTVFDELMESVEEVGTHLQESLKADKTLGPCPECGDDLLVRRSRQGSYFVGCNGYPDCEYTLPLPSTGKPLVMDRECEEHGLRHVKMLAGRKTFVHGCPVCKAEAAEETEDRIVGPCPECGDEHGGELAIKALRSGSRLIGCTRYPDCDYSLPLPRRGEIEVLDGSDGTEAETCDEHGLPHLRIVYEGDREPWELGCPICNYREYQARQKGTELETIDGIGEKTAEKLQEAGITDVEGLKDAEPDDLADQVDGVGPDTVRDWQAKAD